MSSQKKIKYIYDNKGNKTDVIIPINKYENLLEDLADIKAIEDRRHEKSVPLEEIEKRLYKKHGKL